MAPRADAVTIAPVEPTDETALRAWFALVTEARAHDRPGDPEPSWTEFRTMLAVPRPGTVAAGWLARTGTEATGAASIQLPQLDNAENANADVLVAPAYRRRGIGSRLLALLGDHARADSRRRLLLEAFEPMHEPSAGALFLAAAGARRALTEQRRRLDLQALDHAALAQHAAAARAAAAGYDLAHWSGRTPERWLDDIATLNARMSTDAPLDDLSLAPEAWDADRVRPGDAALAARGLVRMTTAAVGADGRLAAFTVLFTHPDTDWFAWQGATLVLREHRGHRLGMLIKLASLESLRARFPTIRVIETFNADSNPYMVSINEAMGFRPYDRLCGWELDL